MAKEMFTGAQIFLKSLEAEGVDEISATRAASF